MDYKLRAFQKHLGYFFKKYGISTAADQEATTTLLNRYVYYLNNNYVGSYHIDTYDKDRLICEYIDKNPDVKPLDAMFDAFKMAEGYLNSSMSINKKSFNDYEKDLQRCQERNQKLRVQFLERINALEAKTKDKTPPDVLTKMHLAFKAGQESMLSVAPLHKKHNFKYWANQIWKYGKAALSMPSTTPHPIYENNENDAHQDLDEVVDNMRNAQRVGRRVRLGDNEQAMPPIDNGGGIRFAKDFNELAGLMADDEFELHDYHFK